MAIDLLKYIFRAPRLEFLREENSDTLVVFIHGIFSNTKSAFKLKNQQGHFWDLFKNKYSFSKIDFASFSYGRIDPSRLKHWESPNMNFIKLAEDLHSQIKKYYNVVLIGHSQGGLLAKTYSILYRKIQGVFFISLHSPHREPTMFVIRTKKAILKEWEEAAYQIPHIFGASTKDSTIVRPFLAFHGCKDICYLAKTENYKKVRHSHLCSCPDPELINLIEKHLIYFRNSGHNRRPLTFTKRNYLACTGNLEIEFLLSSSKLILKKHIDKHYHYTPIIKKPWSHKLFNSVFEKSTDFNNIFNNPNKKLIFEVNGVSINYFVRHIFNFNLPYSEGIKINLENFNESKRGRLIDRSDYLCEREFDRELDQVNPYKNLPFDVFDFDKNNFIDDIDFIEIFCKILETNNYTIRMAYEKPGGNYKEQLFEFYEMAISNSKQIYLKRIWEECLFEYEIGFDSFCQKMEKFILEITLEKQYSFLYSHLYELMKIIFENENNNISIHEIESCFSKMFLCKDSYYCLVRNVRILFSSQRRF
jgi:hypothetical protein